VGGKAAASSGAEWMTIREVLKNWDIGEYLDIQNVNNGYFNEIHKLFTSLMTRSDSWIASAVGILLKRIDGWKPIQLGWLNAHYNGGNCLSLAR
jgi:hypothetical protein